MYYNKLLFDKLLKRFLQIIVGIIAGFIITCQYHSFNSTNDSVQNDLLYPFCSLNGLQNKNDNLVHVFMNNDLAKTFNSIRNLTKRHSDRRLLLVGVMTAKAFIETRSKSIFNTWGQDLIGDIIFFTSSNSR